MTYVEQLRRYAEEGEGGFPLYGETFKAMADYFEELERKVECAKQS